MDSLSRFFASLFVMAIAEPKSHMRFAAPALFSNKNRLHSGATSAQLCVVITAQTLGFSLQSAMTVFLFSDRFFPATSIAMRMEKMCALALAQLKIVKRVVLFIAVFVMNNFSPRQWATECSSHHKSVFEYVPLTSHRIVATDAHLNIAPSIDVASTLPRWISRSNRNSACVMATSELTPAASVEFYLFAAAASAKRWGTILVSHLCRLLCDMCGQGLASASTLRVPSIVRPFWRKE